MTEERKSHRSGHCLRTEPKSTKVLARDKSVMEAFKKEGCWKFCKKLQGGHTQVKKEFALHFTGSSTHVGILNLQIPPEIIALVTEIPRGQDIWFKNFRFNMEPCKVFLKPEFAKTDLTKAVPRNYIMDSYADLLFNIQHYFTCEGRYQKVYSYHFKLLLNFTSMISLDLPYFLCRSLAKMVGKVQLKYQGYETSLFRHGLIKLIVLHELKRIIDEVLDGSDVEWFKEVSISNIKVVLQKQAIFVA